MALLVGHIPFYQQIFAIPGFLQDPVLCFGVQEFNGEASLDGKKHTHLAEYFATLGLHTTYLDHFDPRAELRYDMNEAVPDSEHGRYATFIDIGSVEHVFDSRQCFENCLRMVALGGHYMLHTPVNGYYAHGYHTFHPHCLRDMLDLNGFTRVFEAYCTMQGEPVADPSLRRDVIGWHVARKEREMGRFVCPQQGNWAPQYARKGTGG